MTKRLSFILSAMLVSAIGAASAAPMTGAKSAARLVRSKPAALLHAQARTPSSKTALIRPTRRAAIKSALPRHATKGFETATVARMAEEKAAIR